MEKHSGSVVFTDKSEQVVTRTHDERARDAREAHEHEHGHEHEHEHGHHHHEHGHEHKHHGHDHGHSHSHDDGCGCGDGCGCDHDHGHARAWVLWVRMGVAAALVALGMLLPLPEPVGLIICCAAWVVAAYDLAIGMFRSIAKGDVFNENLLMVVASVGALVIGEAVEGLAVVILYQIGEWLQHRAVERSRASISGMLDLRPERANLVAENGEIVSMAPERVEVGARVLVRAGERVPLDGVVVSGLASFDTSALTGESLPRAASEGDELLAGFISTDGAVTLEVIRPASESAAARLEQLLRETEANRAPTESFIRRFAKVYTPAVIALSVLMAVIGGAVSGEWSEWVARALTLLVASCPCALVLSIPLSFFSGIGGAAKRGVMVKGGAVLEKLAEKELTVVFDKTGTLTEGRFEVREVLPEEGITREELLAVAASAESGSAHPLAAAILAAAGEQPPAANVAELAGLGLIAETGAGRVAVGNAALMERAGIARERLAAAGATTVYVARDGVYLGAILFGDTPKVGAREAIAELRALGAREIVMLTGDAESAAQDAARELGIERVRAELMPEGKLAAVKEMRESGRSVLFVGDGINDAPVLAAADVSIAMANGTNRISVEAADAVIMSGAPVRVVDAVKSGRRTRGIVLQNTALALGVKAVVILLAALGFAPMFAAVFADVGVCMIAVVNSLRALR